MDIQFSARRSACFDHHFEPINQCLVPGLSNEEKWKGCISMLLMSGSGMMPAIQ